MLFNSSILFEACHKVIGLATSLQPYMAANKFGNAL
jgi:hypothetical protein